MRRRRPLPPAWSTDPRLDLRVELRTVLPEKGVDVWTYDLWRTDEGPPARQAAGTQVCLLKGQQRRPRGRCCARLCWLQIYDDPLGGPALPLTPGGLAEAHEHIVARVRSGDLDRYVAGKDLCFSPVAAAERTVFERC